MKSWTPFALTLLALASPLPAAPPPGFPALGREIESLVREHFYDAAKGARWAETNAGYAARIEDAETFRRETRRRLAELGASHTEYYLQDDPGYRDLLSIFRAVLKRPAEGESLGLGLVERDGGWFVARVFPGGPAEAAGLRRGDRLVSADGEPYHPVRSLRGKAGRPVVLAVRSREDGPLRTVQVTPRIADPQEEWLAAQRAGTRVLDRRGHRVGYVPVWSCAGGGPAEALADSLAADLKDAEALVLDLRGGWGGCDSALVALFDPAVPVLTRIDRDGSRSDFAASWRKPLVVLVDGGSRSGKEMVARALQRNRRAVIVGERTAGAVLAGQPILLTDGSLLFLAVEDVRIDGERIEGGGVQPDIAVPATLPYADGADPQLERALEVATSPR
jgi:carboxyl-terminal processing protease